MVKLIVNSDDFGYSPGVNHAIIDTHRQGVLTSTTLMAGGRAFDQAVELAGENPNLGVGVHLTLTYGEPQLEAAAVPSLTDASGAFRSSADWRTGQHRPNFDELLAEWDAQIQRVLAAGITPTHLDSHHHVHSMAPVLGEAIVHLAEKYDLPVRGNFKEADRVRHVSQFIGDFDPVGSFPEAEQAQYFNDVFEKILAAPSTELMCHVGYLDEYLVSSSSYTDIRLPQVRLLSTSDFAEKVKRHPDIELVTYREI